MERRNKVEQKNDVLLIGAAVVDLPLRPVDKTIFDSISYPLNSIEMTVGGDAINEATILSRLGKNVSLISLIGEDIAGSFVLDHAEKNGIITNKINVKKDTTTSINVGLVDSTGERTFVTNRNGSLWKFSCDDIVMESICNAKCLSFASIFNNPLFTESELVMIFERAKLENMIICADMVSPRLDEKITDIAKCFQYIDYFFPNYNEASELTGETDVQKIADIFINNGVKCVVIKLGSDGAYYKTKTEAKLVPAYKFSKCIDTIGAGDNFAAGFICALLDGKSIYDCVIYANAVASISVESVGATTGVKSKEQVTQRLSNYQ